MLARARYQRVGKFAEVARKLFDRWEADAVVRGDVASTPQEAAMPRKSLAAYAAATVLVSVGIAGGLWVPIYARSTPAWGPFPFFYWYQLIWIPVSAILSWLTYLLLRTKPGRARARSQALRDGQQDQM